MESINRNNSKIRATLQDFRSLAGSTAWGRGDVSCDEGMRDSNKRLILDVYQCVVADEAAGSTQQTHSGVRQGETRQLVKGQEVR